MNTKLSSARVLDQFFTKDDIASDCFEMTRAWLRKQGIKPALWLEPSAGAAAFLKRLPFPKVGVDLAPSCPGVIQHDFLRWKPDETNGPIVAIGNPPFGKNASLAIKFFNHAATFSKVIAFIVPRTFEKHSVKRRLDGKFWLAFEKVLDTNSFTFEGQSYAVPCVFQIWERREIARCQLSPTRTHQDFSFVDRCGADFAFQRIGVKAGKTRRDFGDKSSNSHYFIKDLTQDGSAKAILDTIDWMPIKERTAGNPSISKAELVHAYTAALAESELEMKLAA